MRLRDRSKSSAEHNWLQTCDTSQRGKAAIQMIQPRMNTDKRKPVVIRVNPCPSVVKKIFAGRDDFGR
jgi:hypothetical protein